eukprot:COSAG02_NODE_5701_length_4110_cov_2.049115_3_plen_81_part_00
MYSTRNHSFFVHLTPFGIAGTHTHSYLSQMVIATLENTTMEMVMLPSRIGMHGQIVALCGRGLLVRLMTCRLDMATEVST